MSRSLINAPWRVGPNLTTLGIVTGSTILAFFIIGLPSNILIVASILFQKLYKQPTHLLLLSLGVADILTCLLIMPFTVVSGFAGEFVFGESDYTRCKVCQLAIMLVPLGTFSLHTLALISLDRFLFICYPLHYETFVTKHKVAASIIAVCILSMLLGVPPLFQFGDIFFDPPTFSCTPKFDGTTAVTKNVYYMVFVGLEGFIPLTLLTVTNVWILCIACKHVKQIYGIRNNFGNASQQKMYHEGLKTKLQQEKYRKQLQLVRTFGVIFIAHLITWIPLIIRIFQSLILDEDDFSRESNYFIIISITSYPVLHPLIEACLLPDIRKYLKTKCSVCCSKNRKDTKDVPRGCNSITLCTSCMDVLGATVILPNNELIQIKNDVYTHKI